MRHAIRVVSLLLSAAALPAALACDEHPMAATPAADMPMAGGTMTPMANDSKATMPAASMTPMADAPRAPMADASMASMPAADDHAMHADDAMPAASDADLIASAMRAAPAKVSADATIVAMGADHTMRTLRTGHNGFTCMPDSPTTPGPDPMCMDANGLAWAMAWVGKQPPPAGKVGFMYMLEGGTDASNTDPYAGAPAADNHWISTGPHVMVVGADASFYAAYPSQAQPDTGQPYVMWAGTPYQHLMAPIR
jgi:hypothetical protein